MAEAVLCSLVKVILAIPGLPFGCMLAGFVWKAGFFLLMCTTQCFVFPAYAQCQTEANRTFWRLKYDRSFLARRQFFNLVSKESSACVTPWRIFRRNRHNICMSVQVLRFVFFIHKVGVHHEVCCSDDLYGNVFVDVGIKRMPSEKG